MNTTTQTRVEAHNPRRSAWENCVLTRTAGKRATRWAAYQCKHVSNPYT